MGWLPVLLWLAVAFAVVMYVVMDGFDLGIGILLPFASSDHDRDIMIQSVAPFWDGNETWLVLGGTLLIGALPIAYGVLLPAFYVPIMVMLFALIFRGVAFEYRFRASRLRRNWDAAFSVGSLLAAFCQGLVLGAYIKGVPSANGAFDGGTLDFLGGFSIVCGFGLIAGYTLLGASWLVLKTSGANAEFGRRAARLALVLTLAFIVIVSIWTPVAFPYIERRWFSWPDIGWLWPVPLATALVAYGIWRTLGGPRDLWPFLLSIALFLLAFLGLAISLWPFVVPYGVTIWQAASSESTLIFLGVGTAVILPIILGYFAFAHSVFRGKTHTGGGYH
jgi:cytochrome bd ubiquinol oxidase subunit II